MICYSSDEGYTWTSPKVLVDTPLDDRDPSIAQLSNGDILISFFSYNTNDDFDPQGTWLIRSKDNGKSWSSQQIISLNHNTSSPIRELSDGNLIIGLYHYTYDDVSAATAISEDQGQTWTNLSRIENSHNLSFDAETDVVEVGNDTLYAVLRANDVSRNMYYSFSYDSGKNWEISSDIGFTGHCPYLYRDREEGVILLASRFPYTCIRLSTDKCQSWSYPRIIDNVNGAYPSIAKLKNDLLVAYYDDFNLSEKSIIKFKKMTLKSQQIDIENKVHSNIRAKIFF